MSLRRITQAQMIGTSVRINLSANVLESLLEVMWQRQESSARRWVESLVADEEMPMTPSVEVDPDLGWNHGTRWEELWGERRPTEEACRIDRGLYDIDILD